MIHALDFKDTQRWNMTFKSLAAAALLAAGSNASMAALLADGFTPGTPSSVLVAVYDNSSVTFRSDRGLMSRPI